MERGSLHFGMRGVDPSKPFSKIREATRSAKLTGVLGRVPAGAGADGGLPLMLNWGGGQPICHQAGVVLTLWTRIGDADHIHHGEQTQKSHRAGFRVRFLRLLARPYGSESLSRSRPAGRRHQMAAPKSRLVRSSPAGWCTPQRDLLSGLHRCCDAVVWYRPGSTCR